MRHGQPVRLGSRAFDVLLVLTQAGGALVSKDDLMQRAWPGLVVEEANVHVQISQLRKLLGADAIATVQGVGYRFARLLQADGSALGQRHNLPAERTPFVGRASALTAARERLEASRLVTLVGIGGIGKTRLALRLAARAVDEMPDGAWWVDLGPNDDPSRVGASIAQALGCRIDPKASARQALVDHLRSRRLLLVLDNCEHVLEAAAREIEALLDAAPGLLVLTTSREALGIPGETVMPVRPLETPTAQSSLAAMDGFESVRLFLQAAVQAHPDFVLDDANAADIAAICREVDGLPLAVELAAAQMQVLAPQQLLQVLRERFEVLGGPRRALPRQQTLRTIINWSWQNLGPMEQGLLSAVAGCAGGGDLDAVVGLADPRSSTAEAVSGLARLADLSLITVVHGATAARYRVLETVSQFVVEKLTDCGELAALRDRHLAHFCRRTTGWGSDWGGPHDARALADADLNHENVARAIDWALSRHRWQAATAGDKMKSNTVPPIVIGRMDGVGFPVASTAKFPVAAAFIDNAYPATPSGIIKS